MKGNNGTGNNESRDLWQTDQKLFDTLNSQFNFNIDCCANKTNNKCELFYDDFERTKIEDFKDIVVWMNPPFSKASEMFTHFFKVVSKGVAIFRCDNLETKVWQNIILKNCDWIFIPQGRWSYTPFEFSRNEGKGTRFPSALIGIGVEPPKELKGCILRLK